MTAPSGSDIQAAFCQVLVDEWARAGVTDAVVAPGSRSTPLVVAFDADPRIKVHVVLDERSAGFVALGIGIASGRPAVVTTTSGTASVEIHPAVVEAHQAGVPMIAATTDRPPELHHVGAPQTVEQGTLFAGAVRWQVSPGVADLAGRGAWRSLASRCVAEALSGPLGPGPVHLNLAFREPLLGDASAVERPQGRPAGVPWHRTSRTETARAPDEVLSLLTSLAGGRGLVVAGGGSAVDRAEARLIVDAAARLGWPVLADPRSGCRIDGPTITAADALLRVPEVAAMQPELVVTLGAPWASKVLGQWLASLDPGTPHLLVDPWGRWADPDRRATHAVAASPAAVMDAASRGLEPRNTPWLARWTSGQAAADEVFAELLGQRSELALSEPAVARATVAALPARGRLVVSSSMPVRDVEWYGGLQPDSAVIANRGANGIDGVVSTAIGVALAEPRPTAALVGDLAFLYDAGALLWAEGRDLSLTLVVVDNRGGGIFSFLPQAQALPGETFERYWGTPHGLDLLALARAYGVPAVEVQDQGQLRDLVSGCGEPGLRVAVVHSERAANVSAHDLIHAAVGEAVTRLFRDEPGRPGGPGA